MPENYNAVRKHIEECVELVPIPQNALEVEKLACLAMLAHVVEEKSRLRLELLHRAIVRDFIDVKEVPQELLEPLVWGPYDPVVLTKIIPTASLVFAILEKNDVARLQSLLRGGTISIGTSRKEGSSK